MLLIAGLVLVRESVTVRKESDRAGQCMVVIISLPGLPGGIVTWQPDSERQGNARIWAWSCECYEIHQNDGFGPRHEVGTHLGGEPDPLARFYR